MLALAPPPPAVSVATCRPSPEGVEVRRAGGVSLWVRTIGAGKPVLYIPSLGRGAADFDDLARRMAARGYMAILPDPRDTGRTVAPKAATLSDLAADAAAVIAARCSGPVDVVGHAFGNRVARVLATEAPERVADLALLAGGGEAQPTPQVRAALRDSVAQGELPDDRRLAGMRIAFFAKGQDPAVWRLGWFPNAARSQTTAGQATDTKGWWTAGRAPVLLVQAREDPIAPPANGEILKRDIGPRLSLVALPHASHAILPEQPEAVAAVLAAYFDGERREARLQSVIDANVKTPG